MTEFKEIKRVILKPNHIETGQTKRNWYGKTMPRPFMLKIVENDGDGYLLFYCDETGEEMDDTWAETIEGAMAQAEFEYQVKPEEWQNAKGN